MAPIGKSLVALAPHGRAGSGVWGFGRRCRIGKLPGDIYIRRGNFTFYFPLATF